MEYDLSKIGDAYRGRLLEIVHATQRGDPSAYPAAQGIHGEAKRVVDAPGSNDSEREAAREVMAVARRLMEATKP